jgi:hypothetical protein
LLAQGYTDYETLKARIEKVLFDLWFCLTIAKIKEPFMNGSFGIWMLYFLGLLR